jgi:hypothetical protein
MTSPARRKDLRRVPRITPVLVLAAVAGYLLGGCSGGGDLSGVTGFSGVTELPTISLPALPTEAETEPGTTAEAPTTAPERPASTAETEAETAPTAPATTSTIATDTGTSEPPSDHGGLLGWLALAVAAARAEEATTAPEAPPETNADASGPETVAAEPAPSETDTPWGRIILTLGLLLAAIIVGVVAWRRRGRRSESG